MPFVQGRMTKIAGANQNYLAAEKSAIKQVPFAAALVVFARIRLKNEFQRKRLPKYLALTLPANRRWQAFSSANARAGFFEREKTMDEKCCGTCKHWTTEWQNDDENSDVGQCTRFPPLIVAVVSPTWTQHEIERVTKFPVISYVRLCGEWVISDT